MRVNIKKAMAAIAASTMCVIPMANSFSASAAALRKKNAFLVSDSKAVSSSDSSDSSDSTTIAVNSELAEELSKSNALRFYEETSSDTGKTTLDISASELKDMQLEVTLELEALTSRFEAEIAELERVSDMKGLAGSLLRIDGMLGQLDHVFTGIDSLFTMDTKGILAGKTTLNKRIGASLSKLDTLLGNGIGVGVYGPSNFGSTVLGGVFSGLGIGSSNDLFGMDGLFGDMFGGDVFGSNIFGMLGGYGFGRVGSHNLDFGSGIGFGSNFGLGGAFGNILDGHGLGSRIGSGSDDFGSGIGGHSLGGSLGGMFCGGNSGVLCENSCGGFTGVSGQGGYTGVSCGGSKNNTSNGGSKSGTPGGSKSGKSGSSKSGKSGSSKNKKSGEQKHYNTCEDVFGEAACKKAQELLDAASKAPGTTPSGGDTPGTTPSGGDTPGTTPSGGDTPGTTPSSGDDDDKKGGTSSGNNGDGTSCEDPNADRNGSGSGNGKIVIPGGGFTDPGCDTDEGGTSGNANNGGIFNGNGGCIDRDPDAVDVTKVGGGKIVIPGGGFTDPVASKASVRSLRR